MQKAFLFLMTVASWSQTFPNVNLNSFGSTPCVGTGSDTTTFDTFNSDALTWQASNIAVTTGTITGGTTAGIQTIDSTHTATFSKGDLLALRASSSGGTSANMGGWAIGCN